MPHMVKKNQGQTRARSLNKKQELEKGSQLIEVRTVQRKQVMPDILFLNCDSALNNVLKGLIEPNKEEFDFGGPISYVMNASELSNQILAEMLDKRGPQTYSRLQFPPLKLSKAPDCLMSGGQKPGKTTVNYFNSKTNETLPTAPDKSQLSALADRSSSFYQNIRNEIKHVTETEIIRSLMPDYQSAKFSAKRNGIVAAYGANTNQGIVRNYNEDRVAIILNIMRPKSKPSKPGQTWPKCSFFGVYDGHGGNSCADFLRDYLHQFIIQDENFPDEPIKAIVQGFAEAEKLFLEFAQSQVQEVGDVDRAGSCAIIVLVIDEMVYVANTGDSRAVLSVNGGKTVYSLSEDHKPTEENEKHRILNNQGRIYQNASIVAKEVHSQVDGSSETTRPSIVLGPHRVFPGRLSVSRTFGDIEAKNEQVGGNRRVVIADPDIVQFKVQKNMHDFIVIGCDGIFDKMDSKDVVHVSWQAALGHNIQAFDMGPEFWKKPGDENVAPHQMCGLAVDALLKVCSLRRSADNITTVVVGFDNFFEKLQEYRNTGSFDCLEYPVIEDTLLHPIYAPYLNQSQSRPQSISLSTGHQPSTARSANMYIEGGEETPDFAEENDPLPTGAILALDSSPQVPPVQLKTAEEQQSALVVGDTGAQPISKNGERESEQQTTDFEVKAKSLLSEIAEEDITGLGISERHIKLQQQVEIIKNQQFNQPVLPKDTHSTKNGLVPLQRKNITSLLKEGPVQSRQQGPTERPHSQSQATRAQIKNGQEGKQGAPGENKGVRQLVMVQVKDKVPEVRLKGNNSTQVLPMMQPLHQPQRVNRYVGSNETQNTYAVFPQQAQNAGVQQQTNLNRSQSEELPKKAAKTQQPNNLHSILNQAKDEKQMQPLYSGQSSAPSLSLQQQRQKLNNTTVAIGSNEVNLEQYSNFKKDFDSNKPNLKIRNIHDNLADIQPKMPAHVISQISINTAKPSSAKRGLRNQKLQQNLTKKPSGDRSIPKLSQKLPSGLQATQSHSYLTVPNLLSKETPTTLTLNSNKSVKKHVYLDSQPTASQQLVSQYAMRVDSKQKANVYLQQEGQSRQQQQTNARSVGVAAKRSIISKSPGYIGSLRSGTSNQRHGNATLMGPSHQPRLQVTQSSSMINKTAKIVIPQHSSSALTTQQQAEYQSAIIKNRGIANNSRNSATHSNTVNYIQKWQTQNYQSK